LHRLKPDVLCCHGYKADIIGLWAARRCHIPVIAVSRGWTGENRKVQLYEKIDRMVLRWMDQVVCVSQSQADKVREAGVLHERIQVIHNAVHPERFTTASPENRRVLGSLFSDPPKTIIGAAGRLSPEKGFAILIEAARQVAASDASVGFVLFGDGPLREELARQIHEAGLVGRFILAGFRNDLDDLLPALDVMVLPSFTEGLPNVILEAFAAGVPVVATAVGGTPEIVEHGLNGFLAPAGNSDQLAAHIQSLIDSPQVRKGMGEAGRHCVAEVFTFEKQAQEYHRLFGELTWRAGSVSDRCSDRRIHRSLTLPARQISRQIAASPTRRFARRIQSWWKRRFAPSFREHCLAHNRGRNSDRVAFD
jgi:glycosyltransferase involved in cell wall biosynthesis